MSARVQQLADFKYHFYNMFVAMHASIFFVVPVEKEKIHTSAQLLVYNIQYIHRYIFSEVCVAIYTQKKMLYL